MKWWRRKLKSDKKLLYKIYNLVNKLEKQGRYNQTRGYKQHGIKTVHQHSVRVAYISIKIAERLKLNVSNEEMLQGALLHDYFLYDWHIKDKERKLHGFAHPRYAMENAIEDFRLTEKEKNIILRHMFPLTPIPPMYKEAWVVCLADKISAAQELIESIQIWRNKGR